MKKVLAIFLAFIIGLSMSAQIQNKLLGFTLGTSTKYEIRNKYKNERSFSEEDSFIMVRDIRFASQHWDYVAFYFFENKLIFEDEEFVELVFDDFSDMKMEDHATNFG